jgi:NADH-quinone oxidoreductase subunit J
VNRSLLVDVLFWCFAAASVVTGYLVFRTDSMVRAAFWLLASFVAVGAILVLLAAEFLGVVLILMMAGEMLVMAVVMVMYMMNPAGLNPMFMVHQHRFAVAAGVVSFGGLSVVALTVDFPDEPADPSIDATAELGFELLGDSMLVFQTAGVALLATMVGAIALASRDGRFGPADEGSLEPALETAEMESP